MTEELEKKIIKYKMKEHIKICAMSDLHGNLINIEPCDLVLICGDIVPLDIQSNSKKTKKWFVENFYNWANELPCDKVLFIAGNHDLHFRKEKLWVQELFNINCKVTYLENESFSYNGIKIFGTPYCKEFGNWAFMYKNDILKDLFKEIPNDLDILISHDAPYGVSDLILEYPEETRFHIGNEPLREAILERNIKFNFHGHIHSSNHLSEYLGNTEIRNCSICDETYDCYYYPIYITI